MEAKGFFFEFFVCFDSAFCFLFLISWLSLYLDCFSVGHLV